MKRSRDATDLTASLGAAQASEVPGDRAFGDVEAVL